eukprot:scaffold2313_cov103-Alexandrium_tamarense.AAC.2
MATTATLQLNSHRFRMQSMELSLLERALFREVIRQACVCGGKSAAELIGFVVEARIDNVRIAKSLEDLERNVHPTTMQSMMEYCERKHRNNENKMLNAMVSNYDGRVRGGKIGGKIGGAKTTELLSCIMEVGIDNVKVAKSLEDLKCYVHPKTMESMVEYCFDVHDNDEGKMLNAMVLSYDGRVRGGVIGGKIGGAKTTELISFVMEAGIENVRVAKSLKDLKDSVYETTMESMMEYCADVHDNDEKMMLNAMVSNTMEKCEEERQEERLEERKQRSC